MSGEIKPGQGVAAFRLPLPMDGMARIHDAIERVYGTGEATLTFNGDQIQVNAPKDGFGPRKRGRAKPIPPTSDDMQMTHALVEAGNADITVEVGQELAIRLAQAVILWLDSIGAINYCQFGLQSPDGNPLPYVVTVQRAEGVTPHAARERAEAETERLRTVIRAVLETAAVRAESIEDGSGPYGEGWHTGYDHATAAVRAAIEDHLGDAGVGPLAAVRAEVERERDELRAGAQRALDALTLYRHEPKPARLARAVAALRSALGVSS